MFEAKWKCIYSRKRRVGERQMQGKQDGTVDSIIKRKAKVH